VQPFITAAAEITALRMMNFSSVEAGRNVRRHVRRGIERIPVVVFDVFS
jgi:hypothetical protein